MSENTKWDETCYKCYYIQYHNNEKCTSNMVCDMAYNQECDPQVRQYLVGNSSTYQPKFMYRIPNISEKYKKCCYFYPQLKIDNKDSSVIKVSLGF